MTVENTTPRPIAGITWAAVILTAVYILGLLGLLFDTNWEPVLGFLLFLPPLVVVAIVLSALAGRRKGTNRVLGIICGCLLALPVVIWAVIELVEGVLAP